MQSPDLRTTRLLFEQVFSTMTDAVVMANAERAIVLVNTAAEDLFGYAADELQGKLTAVLYTEQAGYEDQGKARYNAQSPADDAPYVMQYTRKDGTTFLGETRGLPLRDADGTLRGFVGIIRDVSTRQTTASALRGLHDIATDATLDGTGRITRMLALGTAHFGLPIGMLGKVEAHQYTVVQSVAPGEPLAPGTTFPLDNGYCAEVLRSQRACGVNDVEQTPWSSEPSYHLLCFEAYLGAPVYLDGVLFGTVSFSSPYRSRPFTDNDREIAQLIADWVGLELARQSDGEALREGRRELARLASTDELTGLIHKRRGWRLLEKALTTADRLGHTLSVVWLAVDDYGSLQPTRGHLLAERAMICFADVVRGQIRAVDSAIRWADGAIFLLLPGTDAGGAETLAGRILGEVNDAIVLTEDHVPTSFSVSVGIAEPHPQLSSEAVVTAVKDAAQRAFDAGGATTRIAYPPQPRGPRRIRLVPAR